MKKTLPALLAMTTSASLAATPIEAVAPDVSLSIVENRPGYNSWPMIQAVGDTLVCAYSRGLRHTTGDGGRGTFARVSRDGGATWGDPICIADSPEWDECAV